MKKQKEYEYLRREIESCLDVVRKANNALYVGVTAILAWAITTHNPTMCLLTYCVIIPTYYIVLDYNISMLKIGAYLLVFCNDKWELRSHKVNTMHVINRHSSSFKNPFIYASVGVTILFFCLLDYSQISFIEGIQVIICIILFLWFTISVFLQKSNDSIKQTYIDAWEKIKGEE